MVRPILLLPLFLIAAGCSDQKPSNEAMLSNEEQVITAQDNPPTERNEGDPPPTDNEIQEDAKSTCPPGVEVCIPRGEVREPVTNRL